VRIGAAADDRAAAPLGDDLKFVLITSAAEVVAADELTVTVTPSTATKCERCWHWRDDVGHDPAHPTSAAAAPATCTARASRAHRLMARAGRAAGGAPGLALWLGLALVVILADQVTKTLILGAFQHGDSRPVTDWFNLVRAHNTGAAFSFLAGASGWQRWFFVGLGIAASGFIVWMMRSHPTQKLFCFAVSMIMGGALGNVHRPPAARLCGRLPAVPLRLLSPIFHGGYFPSFNLADSAITLGAGCLILDEILRVRRAG
jgi:signal peptidase II